MAPAFIAGHLVKKLKRGGYWVREVDLKEHEFAPTQADEFLLLNLREPDNCRKSLGLPRRDLSTRSSSSPPTWGMGFISVAECEVMLIARIHSA